MFDSYWITHAHKAKHTTPTQEKKEQQQGQRDPSAVQAEVIHFNT